MNKCRLINFYRTKYNEKKGECYGKQRELRHYGHNTEKILLGRELELIQLILERSYC